jgi:hypothetical protein
LQAQELFPHMTSDVQAGSGQAPPSASSHRKRQVDASSQEKLHVPVGVQPTSHVPPPEQVTVTSAAAICPARLEFDSTERLALAPVSEIEASKLDALRAMRLFVPEPPVISTEPPA